MKILSPGMKELRSYLKGTKHFLAWVETLKEQYPELPPLFSFLTVDYCAMYPSMPDTLLSRSTWTRGWYKGPVHRQRWSYLKLQERIITLNLEKKIFQQDGGTSIGKKHAPAVSTAGSVQHTGIVVFVL
jgi:hypothetical protein